MDISKDFQAARRDELTSLLNQPAPSPVTGTLSTDYGPGRDEESSGVREQRFMPTPTDSWDSGQWKKNAVLLVAVFLVNSDSAILMTMFRHIASEFNHLDSASWIVTSYIMGTIVAQPLYGKLSDIYGRKPLLLFAYACYCIGSVLVGFGFSFWSIVLGRALCGVGNAGITGLISIIIVDLVPMREVAVWRGYVYAVNQCGRAVGPSLGGFISDQIGWRWAFLYQIPLGFLGLVFVWRRMSFPSPAFAQDSTTQHDKQVHRAKLRRIDFSGSITLGFANVSLLLLLDQVQGTQDYTLSNAWSVILLSAALVFLVIFVAVEAFWAQEPILPLGLFVKRNVASAYGVQFFITAVQTAIYTSVPLYFRVTASDSNTMISIRLLFMVAGTMAGGIISGVVIKRTGRYRRAITLSSIFANLSLAAILLRWQGSASWFESIYTLPIGLGFGISVSAAFIALTAGLEATQVAVATSGFYLCLNLGSLLGISSSALLISSFVKTTLQSQLQHLPDAEKIIRDVTSSLDNIDELPGSISAVVLKAYTLSFRNVWISSLAFGCLALLTSFIMREGRLNKAEQHIKPIPGSQEHGYGTVHRSNNSG